MCEVLEVSASGYFNWLRRSEAGSRGPAGRHSDEAVLAHIRAIHAEVKDEYGWPRMHKELLARGIRVGPHRTGCQHVLSVRLPRVRNFSVDRQKVACPMYDIVPDAADSVFCLRLIK